MQIHTLYTHAYTNSHCLTLCFHLLLFNSDTLHISSLTLYVMFHNKPCGQCISSIPCGSQHCPIFTKSEICRKRAEERKRYRLGWKEKEIQSVCVWHQNWFNLSTIIASSCMNRISTSALSFPLLSSPLISSPLSSSLLLSSLLSSSLLLSFPCM